jgi:hypothetical protein
LAYVTRLFRGLAPLSLKPNQLLLVFLFLKIPVPAKQTRDFGVLPGEV